MTGPAAGSGMKYLLWSACVLSAAAAAWLLLARQDPPCRLPNGSQFTLFKVTYGTTHRMVFGTWLDELKYRRMIGRTLKFLGFQPTQSQHDTEFAAAIDRILD